MITIAPKSSMIAIASKKIFNAMGARDPINANIPSAKAMSVAVGIAQPFRFSGVPQFTIAKIIPGTAMPPMAAMIGKIALSKLDNSPAKTSRFISRPTRKKKIAIKPSLIHKIAGFAISKFPIPTFMYVPKIKS